jgi:hypothetical protein
LRRTGTLFLTGAIILGVARFSLAQDASAGTLADSQDSSAALSTTGAGASTTDAEHQGPQPSGTQTDRQQSESAKPAAQNAPPPQPKRILGVMPNFRAVSAGTIPPPPTPKQAFVIATKNSFDYSSFIFVGITSAFAEWTDAHPQLGQGMPGYGRYFWRGFVDKADGNYWVIFALPSVFHQDERYYARGKGGILKRGIYAASRILITPDYHGYNSFNASELLGRGIAWGMIATPLPLAESVLQVLHFWRENTAYRSDEDWVFASPHYHGKTPYTYQILFRRHIRPVIERVAGIKSSKQAPIGWHTLRRSLATLLISNGENMKVAQSQLRHTTPKITLDLYAQAVSGDQQEAHKKVVQMVLPAQFAEQLKARSVTATA